MAITKQNLVESVAQKMPSPNTQIISVNFWPLPLKKWLFFL